MRSIIHIGLTLRGGAGIGMRRYHEALLVAGAKSRIIVSADCSAMGGPHVATVHRRYARGFERVVRAVGMSRAPEAALGKRLSLANATVSGANYELFSLPYSPYHVEEHAWLKEADVVCLHFVAGFLDWPRFFRRINKPVIMFLHDQQPYLGGFHYERDRQKNPQLKDLDDEVCAVKRAAIGGHCVGVVANSDWNAQAARRSGFFAETVPIVRINYPLDVDVFRPRPRDGAKQAFGVEETAKVIGFACENLDNDRKGFAEFLSALERFPEDPSQELVLLSFGREPSHSLRDRVNIRWIHLGSLETPAAQVAAYSAMDVFVAPSKTEAFGLTAQEALACGCRVVATRTGGLPEALGEFGYYAKSSEPDDIGSALKAAMVDQDLLGQPVDWVRDLFPLGKTGIILKEFLAAP